MTCAQGTGTGPPRPSRAGSPGAGGTARLVKRVVWDIDHTLLDGVYLEAGEHPPAASPVLAGLLRELGGRGILHAIASKNPPGAAVHAARATGWEFVVAECGWGRKSDALTRIAEGLGIGVDTLAFVDDDPYERAEVSFALPQVLVLSPQEAVEAPGWPAFRPPTVTDEARRRGARTRPASAGAKPNVGSPAQPRSSCARPAPRSPSPPPSATVR